MSGKTLKEKVEWARVALVTNSPETEQAVQEALTALENRVKELEGKDRYEFPVNEWNEQLIQTINDTGCPAKIVLTRRKPRKTTEGINEK